MSKILKYDIYISGRMTGLPNFNRERFNRVADMLRNDGYTVFNPAEINPEKTANWDWSDYMRVALQGQVQSKSILMLIGYQESKGAMIEYELAQQLNMNIVYEEQLYSNKTVNIPRIKTAGVTA